MPNFLIEAVDEVLPQTQCTRCGYPSCRDYARALVDGKSSLNRCPPGGEATIAALAKLLLKSPLPLDPSCGSQGPLSVAFIDESWCIGCTICLEVCPVDAIVGAAKRMHTILALECTGCELCVQPCPTDCIEMVPVASHSQAARLPAVWTTSRAKIAKRRYDDRQARRARLTEERRVWAKRRSLRHAGAASKRLAIERSVARVRASQDLPPVEGVDESIETC